MIHIMLENPVRLTESAVLPLARLVRKLETFPPGQAATRNIPKATDGGGFIISTKHQVRNGRSKNCEKTPRIKPFGFFERYLKSSNLRSRATPYMISARARLRSNKSLEEKLSWIESSSEFGVI